MLYRSASGVRYTAQEGCASIQLSPFPTKEFVMLDLGFFSSFPQLTDAWVAISMLGASLPFN